MDNIIYPFSLPIYTNKIKESSFQIIKNEINEYIKNNKDCFSLEWGCPTLSNINAPESKKINSPTLIKEIKSHVRNYFENWNFKDPNLKINLLETWINISPPNSYQEFHHHSLYHLKNIFSGVIYIEALENSGPLVLDNPLSPYLQSFPISNKYKEYFFIKPQNGNISIFPSYIKHAVGANKSTQNRISVSWNINLIN